ncbi:hypothetical protein BDZ97DRAFT_104070 [Flammula alnicola]|nr:hypothetical protein BDZ97DRAFT_104070 [Flammula alnicola]
MSGHPGFTINWSTKDARLLDWLDENPVEREIIFQKESIKGQKFSKRECTIKAAREIFSVDADIIIRRIAQKDPAHLRKKLADYFRHLKVKYQKFNKIIGPAASNSRYEDLEVGGETHRTIERLLTDSFPIWTRLHVYWRTLSHYNQYYSSSNSSQKARKPPPSSGVVPSKARTRWQTTTSKMRASKRLKHRGVSEEVSFTPRLPVYNVDQLFFVIRGNRCRGHPHPERRARR